jgi:uncharacterized membrane protein YgcG
MTWFADASNQTAAEAAHVELITFVSLDLSSGVLRMHTRGGTISWGGYDWLGAGKFGQISDIDEDAQLRPSGVTIALSGVDAALITAAVDEEYHGRAIAIYQGFLNLTTHALIATPETIFVGLMDFMTVELGQNTGSIAVQCEGELARWQRHNGHLYTHESQQVLFPGDRGFDQIPFLENRRIDWSKSNVFQSSGGSGGGGGGDGGGGGRRFRN